MAAKLFFHYDFFNIFKTFILTRFSFDQGKIN
jgi:hypothetical protein